jgi:hypothetical protein
MSTGVDQLVFRQWISSIKAEEVYLVIYLFIYDPISGSVGHSWASASRPLPMASTFRNPLS